MAKTALTMVITSILLAGGVFAHDCDLVTKKESTEITVQKYASFDYKGVIPREALQKALSNLRSYCCTQKIIACEKGEAMEEYYPKSPFLFDHILDVTMRRLDGVQNLAYGLEPDKAGKARRDYMIAVASNPNGEMAKTISETYADYRSPHTETSLDNANTYFSGANNKDIFSLGDKYNTVCDLMRKAYGSFKDDVTIIGGKFEKNSFYRKCEKLVENRVDRENSYVKLIMLKQSGQMMDRTMKTHTQTYFVEDKLMALWNLISNVKSVFQTIVQQAAAAKTCSK